VGSPAGEEAANVLLIKDADPVGSEGFTGLLDKTVEGIKYEDEVSI
jgi:hypothetical protein